MAPASVRQNPLLPPVQKRLLRGLLDPGMPQGMPSLPKAVESAPASDVEEGITMIRFKYPKGTVLRGKGVPTKRECLKSTTSGFPCNPKFFGYLYRCTGALVPIEKIGPPPIIVPPQVRQKLEALLEEVSKGVCPLCQAARPRDRRDFGAGFAFFHETQTGLLYCLATPIWKMMLAT
jgi:hypothetical protein